MSHSTRRVGLRKQTFPACIIPVLIVLSGCGGGDSGGGSPGPTAPLVPTTLTITGSGGPLQSIGATVQLTGTVKNQQGGVVAGASITWSSADPSVATVSTTGLVTAVAQGTSRVQASSSGITASVDVVVALVPASLIVLQGNDQSGVVGGPLETPLEVEIRDALGNPIPDHQVSFAVTSGGRSMASATVNTGSDGKASAIWTLGTATGEAHAAQATAGTQSADFSATPLPDEPAGITAQSGDNQTGLAGEALAMLIIGRVGDQFDNPVPEVEVTWSVTPESGAVSSATSITDEDGLASVAWTLEAHAGEKSLSVTLEGLPPVSFSANALPNGVIEGTAFLSNASLAPPQGVTAAAGGQTGKRSSLVPATTPRIAAQSSQRPQFVPDELLVTLRESPGAAMRVESSAIRTVVAATQRAGLLRAQLDQSDVADRFEILGVSAVLGTARIKLNEGDNLDAVAELLLSDPRIRRVQRNWLYYLDGPRTSDSERRGAAHALSASATFPTAEPLYPWQAWHYEAIGLPQAWKITKGDPNVIVAVIDDGIRFDHSDIATNLTTDGFDFVEGSATLGCDFSVWNTSGDGDGRDSDPTNPMDWIVDPDLDCILGANASGAHGLHVAGTIAAAEANTGGVGVAPGVRVRPIRVFGTTGGTTSSDLASGILYAAGLPADGGSVGQVQTSTAHVINMSLGGTEDDPILHAALILAQAAGSLLIASAGKSTSTPSYPAAYPEVMAVSAIGPDWFFSTSFSNWGAHIEIAAPGGDGGLMHTEGTVFSDTWNYQTDAPEVGGWNGTSMAAPHVAGVAALLFSQDPSRTNAEVRALLNQYSVDLDPVGRDVLYGNGLVDAYSALTLGEGIPGDAWIQLRDASTGRVVETQITSSGGQFRFEGLDDGTYLVFGGLDEFSDGLLGVPPRWWGAFGGSATPMPFTFDGAEVQDGSFTIGFPIESEPNGLIASANQLPVGGYLNGTLTTSTDSDFFVVQIPEGGTYTFETTGWWGACGLALGGDTALDLLNEAGALLATHDDIDTDGRNHCSLITATLDEGTYFIRVYPFGAVPEAVGFYRVVARAGS